MTLTNEVPPPAVAQAAPHRQPVPVWLYIIGAVGIIVAIAAVVTPGFLTPDNVRAILHTTAITGIVAVTMTPMTLSGNLGSLSTQQSSVLGAVLFATLVSRDWNVVTAALAVLVVVVAVSVAQGLVVAAGLNPIITTLAAGSVIAGSVAAASRTTSISFDGASTGWLAGSLLGVPASVFYFLAVTVVVTWLMRKTVLGRRVMLSGSNRETARLTGVPQGATVIWVFVILGVGCTLAGLIGSSQVGYANTLLFGSMTFDVIAAVVIGGTSIRGGYGSPLWSAGGALLMSVINNLLLLHGFPYGVRILIVGLLVVGSISALQLLPGRRAL